MAGQKTVAIRTVTQAPDNFAGVDQVALITESNRSCRGVTIAESLTRSLALVLWYLPMAPLKKQLLYIGAKPIISSAYPR